MKHYANESAFAFSKVLWPSSRENRSHSHFISDQETLY